MNGQGPGIWIPEIDADGLVKSYGVVVSPCANEPPETAAARETDPRTPLAHGLACWVFDGGETLLCRACGDARTAEEARQARLRRLPPWAREFLQSRGVTDWRPR